MDMRDRPDGVVTFYGALVLEPQLYALWRERVDPNDIPRPSEFDEWFESYQTVIWRMRLGWTDEMVDPQMSAELLVQRIWVDDSAPVDPKELAWAAHQIEGALMDTALVDVGVALRRFRLNRTPLADVHLHNIGMLEREDGSPLYVVFDAELLDLR